MPLHRHFPRASGPRHHIRRCCDVRRSGAIPSASSVLAVSHDFDGLLRTRGHGFVAPRSRSWGSPGFGKRRTDASPFSLDFRRIPPVIPSAEAPSTTRSLRWSPRAGARSETSGRCCRSRTSQRHHRKSDRHVPFRRSRSCRGLPPDAPGGSPAGEPAGERRDGGRRVGASLPPLWRNTLRSLSLADSLPTSPQFVPPRRWRATLAQAVPVLLMTRPDLGALLHRRVRLPPWRCHQCGFDTPLGFAKTGPLVVSHLPLGQPKLTACEAIAIDGSA